MSLRWSEERTSQQMPILHFLDTSFQISLWPVRVPHCQWRSPDKPRLLSLQLSLKTRLAKCTNGAPGKTLDSSRRDIHWSESQC